MKTRIIGTKWAWKVAFYWGRTAWWVGLFFSKISRVWLQDGLFLWRCQHVLKKSWKRISLGESWVVCKENTTQSLKTSWKEFIKCPCQDQLQWSIQCTFGRYFVGLETARWELYLRFYDLYFNYCFRSLYVLYIIYIYIYICTYIMYINTRTPLWDYVCKTSCCCLPPLDFRLRHGSDMRFLCGRADRAETGGVFLLGGKPWANNKSQKSRCMYKTPERKNWPFLLGGFSTSLPILWVEIFLPNVLPGVSEANLLEDLVDELPWILGQEEEQIVVMPGP